MRPLSLFLIIACGSPPAAKPIGNAAVPVSEPAGLPADVKAFVERWETCWHWSGEEPYDAARAQEIRLGVENSCPGNEEERERLRLKWKDRRDVQDALRKLDEMQ